jgi:hypothetical protein|tara:strand:- start:459 stop:656 length:198 start_codon:yes stop_codon:yes gene_type:complete
MNDRIKEALKLKYLGIIAEAEVNVRIYLKNPVGIGEHADIVGAIDEQIEIAANAQEKLDWIENLD